jgi:hypothetical protein
MSESHSEKYFGKLVIGFGAIVASIFIIFLAVFEAGKQGDWYFWALFAAFLMCGGIYFTLQAMVHKVKSDFSRRAKQREAQRSRLDEK